MNAFTSKTRGISVAAGVLLAGSELSAQTISWGATDVPMSMTSLALLAGMFLLLGAWGLSKAQKHVQQFALAAVLVGGVYGYAVKAIAVPTVEITTSSGTANLVDGYNDVCNAYVNAVTITAIEPHGCAIHAQSCEVGTVLDSEDCCYIDISCEV